MFGLYAIPVGCKALLEWVRYVKISKAIYKGMNMVTFHKNPSLIPIYLRAFASIMKPKTTNELPPLEARMMSGIDSALLNRYKQVCTYEASSLVPITFPYALAGSLQLWLWTRPEFPVRVVGAVHVRNRIESFRELIPGEELEMRVRSGECRQVRLGTEHDVITELVDSSGKIVWLSTSTNMAPEKPKEKRTPSHFDEPAYDRITEISVPKGIGLKYGTVCRDLNPIHLHPMAARVFGFKTAIAHGMWAIARSLTAMEREDAHTSVLNVRFRKPIPIPKRVQLHHLKVGNVTHFALKNLAGDVTHLEGSIEFRAKFQ